jgi:hypothetical protein
MLRRYLVALVGAVVGGGAVAGIFLAAGRLPNYLLVSAAALGVAGFLMAKGEDLGLVPPSEDIGKPTSIFSDEKERRK